MSNDERDSVNNRICEDGQILCGGEFDYDISHLEVDEYPTQDYRALGSSVRAPFSNYFLENCMLNSENFQSELQLQTVNRIL